MIDICVVMSVYNEPIDYVQQAINSVLNQTKKDFCFVIVCDNPEREELVDCLRENQLKDERIILYINDVNIGLAQSLNTGINLVDAKYYARMDADDISVRSRLEHQFYYMEQHQECDILSSSHVFIDGSGQRIGEDISLDIDTESMHKILLLGNPIIHPSLMVRGEVYRNLKGYRNLPAAEDYDFYLRALDSGYQIVKIPDVLLLYRKNNSGMTLSNIYKTLSLTRYIRRRYRQNSRSFEKEIQDFAIQHHLNDRDLVEKRNVTWQQFNDYKASKSYFSLLFLMVRNPWLALYVLDTIIYLWKLKPYRR